jgi:hypothetical protein
MSLGIARRLGFVMVLMIEMLCGGISYMLSSMGVWG